MSGYNPNNLNGYNSNNLNGFSHRNDPNRSDEVDSTARQPQQGSEIAPFELLRTCLVS
jgi:hypothetical protein